MIARFIIWLNRLFGRSDIYFQNSLYMRRWRLGGKRTWGLRLHHILRSDADREFHDHPFWFISLMVRGSYTEHYIDGTSRTFKAPALLFRQARCFHRLTLDKPVWTLLLRGPYNRDWGFVAGPWVPWQHFVETREQPTTEPAPAFRAESSL